MHEQQLQYPLQVVPVETAGDSHPQASTLDRSHFRVKRCCRHLLHRYLIFRDILSKSLGQTIEIEFAVGWKSGIATFLRKRPMRAITMMIVKVGQKAAVLSDIVGQRTTTVAAAET